MIIATNKHQEDGGEFTPVSHSEIAYIWKLLHTCTLPEHIISRIESRVNNVEFTEELYEIIDMLKQHQKMNLNEQFDDALRRAI